jgi:hypothetical protein
MDACQNAIPPRVVRPSECRANSFPFLDRSPDEFSFACRCCDRGIGTVPTDRFQVESLRQNNTTVTIDPRGARLAANVARVAIESFPSQTFPCLGIKASNYRKGNGMEGGWQRRRRRRQQQWHRGTKLLRRFGARAVERHLGYSSQPTSSFVWRHAAAKKPSGKEALAIINSQDAEKSANNGDPDATTVEGKGMRRTLTASESDAG